MLEEQLPRYYTAISSDIVGSSAGGYLRHDELSRTTRQVIDAAVAGSARPEEWVRGDRGDGELSLAPDGVAPAWILANFLPNVRARIIAYNRNKDKAHRLRLRFGLDCGDVLVDDRGAAAGGEPVIIATRLQGHPANREAMDAVPEAVVSVLLSDAVYRRVVPHNAMGLEPHQFRRLSLTVQGDQHTCWLYLPGHQPPMVHEESTGAPPSPAPEDRRSGSARSHGDINISHANGVQIGDYNISNVGLRP